MSQGPGQPISAWSAFLAKLSGTSPPANQISQLASTQQPGVSQVNTRLFVHPKLPTNRYNNLPGAPTITTIDLINMTITDIDGIAQPLGSDPLLANNVNSIMIFVSDADTIIRTDDGQMFNDHKLYHVINFLHSKSIQITPPSGKLPNVFDLAFVLSNEPIMPYALDLELAHTKKTNTVNPVTDAFVDLYIVHLGGYDQLTCIITENGLNDIDYQVLVSEDDVNYYVLPNMSFPVKIPKGTFALFTTNIKWHFYKIQVKNDVAGSAGSASVSSSPIR